MSAASMYQYTQDMKAVFRENMSELKSYYCREDFVLALSNYDRAPADAKKFCEGEVKRLCKARELDAQTLFSDRSLLEQIPTREEMLEKLLQAFYELYVKAPSAGDYMERIVRRLAPEYSRDSVRLAILKKFLEGAGDHFQRFSVGPFFAWAADRLEAGGKAKLEQLPEKEKKELLLSKLDESVFDQKPVELTDAELLGLMADQVRKYSGFRFEADQLQPETRKLLYDGAAGWLQDASVAAKDNGAKALPEETAAELLLAAASAAADGRISAKDLECSGLAVCLEKDLRAQLKKVKWTQRTGQESTLDQRYRQAKKDALKAKRERTKNDRPDPELLELCSDLACGNFRANGKTKVFLYYFAFMFDMQVPLPGKECPDEKNVVKNLFQDYYNDNLLRLLSGDYADPGRASRVEREPTGEGINYKNFAEMIYLCFLCRKEPNLTPGERIDRAERLIKKCVEQGNQKKAKAGADDRPAAYTFQYRDRFLNELLHMPEDELAGYITEHYRVVSPDKAVARIMLDAEERTASGWIDEIMEELDEEYPDLVLFDLRQRQDLTGRIREDRAFQGNAFFDWKLKPLLEARFSGDADFMKIVAALDDRTRIRKGRFRKTDRERLLVLLHVLAVYSSEQNPLSSFRIQRRMEEKGVTSAGGEFGSAVGTLRDLGYDIQRNRESYFLGSREYGDGILNDLLKRVSGRYFSADGASDLLLADALVSRLKADKRVTRSELISLHLNCYIALLYEKDLESFPVILADYEADINPILEEARYQPISKQNLFDMYVVISLYAYLIEHMTYLPEHG